MRFFSLFEGKKVETGEFLLKEMLGVVDKAAWAVTACH
jgi:hypothetical protein